MCSSPQQKPTFHYYLPTRLRITLGGSLSGSISPGLHTIRNDLFSSGVFCYRVFTARYNIKSHPAYRVWAWWSLLSPIVNFTQISWYFGTGWSNGFHLLSMDECASSSILADLILCANNLCDGVIRTSSSNVYLLTGHPTVSL